MFDREDVVLQAIGFAQRSGRWLFSELQRRYELYLDKKSEKRLDLRLAHQDAFQLENPLEESSFNQRQHLYVVGSAANERLIEAIDYWKKQGSRSSSCPTASTSWETSDTSSFFSFPYDRHPAAVKGVLFDTNRTYNENSLWEMMEKSRVAAYGDIKYVVEYLNPDDTVFFYHKWEGIVAAGVVTGPVRSDGDETGRFLTELGRVLSPPTVE